MLPWDSKEVLLGINHPLTNTLSPSASCDLPQVRAVMQHQKAVEEKQIAANETADKLDVMRP